MGYEDFVTQARDAGLDGALVVDLPPEESHDLVAGMRSAQLELVYLLAPTSTEERIAKIADAASGFVYYVSVKGVTGAGHLDLEEVAAKLASIRRIIDLPVGVGFGIKDADTAARIAQVADAVIVGSAIVQRMEDLAAEPKRIPEVVADFLRDLRAAIDGAAGI